MARNTAGKWVARAGATGGGRTYRGQVPTNWYAALVIIVILGVLSIVFAGYEYRHPANTSSTPPTKGTTWYAGLSFDVCGTEQPPLASNAATTSSKQAFFTSGNGVVTVAPKTAAQSGDNAVLGKFVSAYSGLGLTSTELKLPSASSGTTTTTAAKGATSSSTYKNGEACPKGTPDAGKKGEVQVVYWASAFASKDKAVTVQGDPSDLKFTQNQLITVGFVPAGTKLAKDATVVKSLITASTGGTTTSTTGAATAATTTTGAATAATTTTPTTAPASPTTTAPTP